MQILCNIITQAPMHAALAAGSAAIHNPLSLCLPPFKGTGGMFCTEFSRENA